MDKEENIQEKYKQFKLIQNQIEQVSKHLQLWSEQIEEIENSKQALEELAKVSLGSEMLVPMADGIFVRANFADKETVIINVGADTAVEKSFPQGIELLEKQREDILQRIAQAETVLEEMQVEAMRIYKIVEELAKE